MFVSNKCKRSDNSLVEGFLQEIDSKMGIQAPGRSRLSFDKVEFKVPVRWSPEYVHAPVTCCPLQAQRDFVKILNFGRRGKFCADRIHDVLRIALLNTVLSNCKE